jgi:hypothetical protein
MLMDANSADFFCFPAPEITLQFFDPHLYAFELATDISVLATVTARLVLHFSCSQNLVSSSYTTKHLSPLVLVLTENRFLPTRTQSGLISFGFFGLGT